MLSLKVVFIHQHNQYFREEERVNPAELPNQPPGGTEQNSLELPEQPPHGILNRLQLVMAKQSQMKSEFLSHVKITRGDRLFRWR